MTKAEIVNEITLRTGAEKSMVMAVVEGFFDVAKISMLDGNNLYFRGFGTFELKKRKSKVARNITKNTSLVVPPHFTVKFKPAKDFTEKLKSSKKLDKMLKQS